MRWSLVPIALLVSVALSVVAMPVAAQGAPPVSPEREAQLDEQYRVAQEHYLAKRYTEALPLFEGVARELDSPNAMLYVARCLHRMDRHVEAYRAMERTVARAAERAQTEKRFVDTRDVATRELGELQAHVGRVTIRVHEPPPGLVVEVGGQPLADLDQVLVVLPGLLVVTARADGVDPVRQELQVAGGSRENVVIRFAAPVKAPAPVPGPIAPPATTSSGGYVRYAGIGVAGVGVLGFTLLAVAGVLADERFEDIEERCNGQRCTNPDDQDDIDEGRTYDIAANAGLVVGIVGTVAGTLMIIFGGPRETTVDAGLAPGGGWVAWRQRF
jgi:hypothetical protein